MIVFDSKQLHKSLDTRARSQFLFWALSRQDSGCHGNRKDISHLSLGNSHRGSSGRSYSGMGSSCAELRRVVMRTRGVLEFMEELESAETCRRKGIGWSPRSGFRDQFKLQGITRGVYEACMTDCMIYKVTILGNSNISVWVAYLWSPHLMLWYYDQVFPKARD